jgi:hypothetical protein
LLENHGIFSKRNPGKLFQNQIPNAAIRKVILDGGIPFRGRYLFSVLYVEELKKIDLASDQQRWNECAVVRAAIELAIEQRID